MPVTKHKTFKINIPQSSTFDVDNLADEKINAFLSDQNNIYINHSVCILTESIEEYGNVLNINRFVLISLIYKDLNATEMDISNASPAVKQIVRREVKKDSKIPKPRIETDFDKTISALGKARKSHKPSPEKNWGSNLGQGSVKQELQEES
jgi:hypothetical protein